MCVDTGEGFRVIDMCGETQNSFATYGDIVFVLNHSSTLEIMYINRTQDLEIVLDIIRRKPLNGHTLIIRNMENLHLKPLQRIAYKWCKIKVLELPDIAEAALYKTPRMLSKIRNLRRLSLHHYHSIPENSLNFIVDGCPYLEELYIPWVIVREPEFVYLIERRKETLRGLCLYGCMLTEVSLCKLSELQSLRALSLFKCKQMDISIFET